LGSLFHRSCTLCHLIGSLLSSQDTFSHQLNSLLLSLLASMSGEAQLSLSLFRLTHPILPSLRSQSLLRRKYPFLTRSPSLSWIDQYLKSLPPLSSRSDLSSPSVPTSRPIFHLIHRKVVPNLFDTLSPSCDSHLISSSQLDDSEAESTLLSIIWMSLECR
jgi:hypothetical protein